MPNINRFFIETLGGQLKNPRWSWGAVDPMNHRVFLRVWSDGLAKTVGKERAHIATSNPVHNSNGFAERHAHIDLIRQGAEGFGVLCIAVDPHATGARRIKSFDDQILLQFGDLTEENGDTFVEIVARVPVALLANPQTGNSTLSEDLRAIIRKKVEPTIKRALIDARVGQGLFRKQVLSNWENACAVTGSQIRDVIRASHIKPWRESNDSERLDPFNGLPLVAGLDALFDAGLITFSPEGVMEVSSLLSSIEKHIHSVSEQSLRKPLPSASCGFLAYHRAKLFRE